jgi:hypothetical protein
LPKDDILSEVHLSPGGKGTNRLYQGPTLLVTW